MVTPTLLRPFALALVVAASACAPEPSEQQPGARLADSGQSALGACVTGRPRPAADHRVVAVYFACDRGAPGTLYPVYRSVPGYEDALVAAVGELVRGPTATERTAGFRSHFSTATSHVLRSARRSADGDTLMLDFAEWGRLLPDGPYVRSFLPPGILADLTWTVFKHEPDRVEAVRFSIEGDEAAFWRWVAPDASQARPRAFTRSDWERI